MFNFCRCMNDLTSIVVAILHCLLVSAVAYNRHGWMDSNSVGHIQLGLDDLWRPGVIDLYPLAGLCTHTHAWWPCTCTHSNAAIHFRRLQPTLSALHAVATLGYLPLAMSLGVQFSSSSLRSAAWILYTQNSFGGVDLNSTFIAILKTLVYIQSISLISAGELLPQ